MSTLRALALPLLSLVLLAGSATAQTMPNKMARKPKPHTEFSVTPAASKPGQTNSGSKYTKLSVTPAARAADPLRGTNDNGKGQNGYAAPGQPINVQDNGKNTPPYDGPAAGRTAAPAKGMTMPRKQ